MSSTRRFRLRARARAKTASSVDFCVGRLYKIPIAVRDMLDMCPSSIHPLIDPLNIPSHDTPPTHRPINSTRTAHTLQIHSHRHTPPTNQQHGPQPLCQNLQITNILDALLLAATRARQRTRQRRKHNGRVRALRPNQLVEHQMLRATRQVVERERNRLLRWEPRCAGRRARCWDAGSGRGCGAGLRRRGGGRR